MKTKKKLLLTLGLLSLFALGGLTQSKYVRNSVIEMEVTSETDPGVFSVNNTLVGNNGLPWTTYTIPKTGYYAVQLRGGDGGTNGNAIGGKGGIVEAVYYFVKDQQIQYTLGGRGGWYSEGSNNKASGTSGHAAGGAGGTGSNAAREGAGGGGASAIRLLPSENTLLVAGGGGGGGGNGSDQPSMAGVGASNVDGAYGPSNYPNATGRVLAREIDRRRTDDNIAGQNHLLAIYNWGGGGSGGGFTASYAGGRRGASSNTYAGAGTGGHSYIAPTVNSVGFIALTNTLKSTFAAKLPTIGSDDFNEFTPFNDGTNTGGGRSIAGRFRIAYLWSDATADHKAIDNIYK